MADRSNGCWLRQSIDRDTLTHGQMIAVQSTPSIMWMERAIRIPCRRPEARILFAFRSKKPKKKNKRNFYFKEINQSNYERWNWTRRVNLNTQPTQKIQNAHIQRRPRIAKSVHSFVLLLLLLLLLLSPTKYKTSHRMHCSIGIWRRRLMEHLPICRSAANDDDDAYRDSLTI